MADGRPTTSTRDVERVIEALGHWMRQSLALDGVPQLRLVGGPTSAGFSSDTVLFDVVGAPHDGAFVLRMPPPPEAFPLFPTYDLGRQVAAMRIVAERTAAPVPRVVSYEPDPGPLGVPFFVMQRIDGRPAPDVPPYVLEGWVTEVSDDARKRMEADVVDILGAIHGLDGRLPELAFLELDPPGATPLRRHVEQQRLYYDWIRGEERLPLIDAAFEWLEARWPRDEGAAVLSWGDARVANILFRDATPAAVLDWESVALGPRELDLGWLLYFHDYFQRIAIRMGRPGLPDFLQREAVTAAYADRTGYTPRDLDWYLTYAALRQALVSIRVSARAVHFGERSEPDDPQDLVMDRAHLEGLLNQ